jgi:hypothetical protein
VNRTTPCLVEPLEARIAPAAFVVSTLHDTTDAAHDTGSLRDAIFLVNADPSSTGDKIIFEKIVHGIPEPLLGKIVLSSDLPQITNDVTIAGPIRGDANALIIDLNGHQGLSFFGSGINVHDLTLTKGVSHYGGGLYISASGRCQLTDVTISGNRAVATSTDPLGRGGGIYIRSSSATDSVKVDISQSKITGNVAAGIPRSYHSNYGGYAAGGGIYCGGSGDQALYITNSIVSRNVARGGDGESGAGASSAAPSGESVSGGGISTGYACNFILNHSHVTGNKAIGGNGGVGGPGQAGGFGGDAAGGAIYAEGHTLVTKSLISGNLEKGGSGGAYGVGGGQFPDSAEGGEATGGGISTIFTAQLVIKSSVILGNVAVGGKGAGAFGIQGGADGGGVYADSPLTIVQSIVAKNAASFNGGGIFAEGAKVTIFESTLMLNAAVNSGGALQTEDETVRLEYNTIVGNYAHKHAGIDEDGSPFP